MLGAVNEKKWISHQQWQVQMLDFRRQLDLLEVPERRLNMTLDKVLGQVIREAARRWLRKYILHVPAETGMARGALRPLGQFLRLAVPIRPTRKPYFSQLEGVIQDIDAGEAMNYWNIVDDKSGALEFVYEFEWSTNMLHYYSSQYYNGKALSGEEVLPIAESAFTDHIQSTLANRVAQSIQGIIQIREI